MDGVSLLCLGILCSNCMIIIKNFIKNKQKKVSKVSGRLFSVLVEKSIAEIYQIFPLSDFLVAEQEYQSTYLFQRISSSVFLSLYVCISVHKYISKH